jgi:hypothetical protein
MVNKDALTNDKLPCARKYGGMVIGFVTGASKPSLIDRRNELAHGYPFDGAPTSGLLELIRDLIEYAYRYAARAGADQTLNQADHDGQRVWLRIKRAVAELQAAPTGPAH